VKYPPLVERLQSYCEVAEQPLKPQVDGRLVRIVGLTLEAVGCHAPIGGRCHVHVDEQKFIEAEVVGFSGEKIYLMPIHGIDGLHCGARVTPIEFADLAPVGIGLLGRVIDGAGKPLDNKGALQIDTTVSLTRETINPLDRKVIDTPLDVGVRALNGLLAIGRGQRLGLFAGSGVGKSILLGMMTRFTTADVTVVALVGERGREVKEFVDIILGPKGMANAVVVVSPADDSPLMRMRAATLATCIAEYFRDQNKNVLLLMDSLTRFAQAQREIALAIGEPPATKGYPPSVFAKIPQLVERAGNAVKGKGSITAFYTVLTEGDDQQDPVADAARAILDGHVVLSRSLAEEGHYPAIDVEASISRAMPYVVSAEHFKLAQRFKAVYARYQQNRDLISVGAYAPGRDSDTDYAIERMPFIKNYLQQGLDERVSFSQSLQQLNELLIAPPVTAAKTIATLR
jgi:flagellum-specific ATP synthase